MMKKRDQPQVLENIEITALSSDGRGIARMDGMVIFVDDAVKGDTVDVQIYRKKSGYREGKAIRFYVRSKDRSEPVCQHFGVCGGCTWQSLQYKAQLEHKHQTVCDALHRIGKIELPPIEPILGAPEPFAYRNKMEYTFSALRWFTDAEIASDISFANSKALGFHVPGRYDKILPIERCFLQDDLANRIRNRTRELTLEADFTFYHQKKHEGLLRNLMLRNTQAGEWMLVLSATEWNEKTEDILSTLRVEFPQIVSMMYAVNTKKNDVWFDLDIQLFAGLPYLEERMEDLVFRIGPKSFYQTNPKQAYNLYRIVRDFAGLAGTETVYDLYCGTGTISLFLARSAKKVLGVEYVADAVHDANQNALINSITNTRFFAGDMKDVLSSDFFTAHGSPDVIITDPPRAGMHPDVCERIVESGAQKVVYVSCNPSTQARDLALLDGAYKVAKVQPIDMFPQTTHVENCVLLLKR
ncbi:MAG: 23S rRNA (uracil(1939)-C(5))-methyltransferase RlmD [Bacteroidia bacterium]